jgi:DNA repair/transcription protein MET18/MMS19
METIFEKILKKFEFENFNIPNYNYETRSFAYKILMLLLNYHDKMFFLDKIPNYLQIVIDAIDGEKDPRNIILIFDFVYKINTTLDKPSLSSFNKRFFEILDEYYPIEFTPPKNSPEKITAELLSTKLNNCLASNEEYMPYLLEAIKGNF